MNPFAAFVASGSIEQAIRQLAARGIKRISGTEKWYYDMRRRAGQRMGIESAREWGAWNRIWDTAVRAVNRANRAVERGGTLFGPSGSPSVVIPGGTGGVRVEYHVVVEYVDPNTGGKNRVSVVVDSPTGLGIDRLNTLAGALGMTPDFWAQSGKRGEIEPAEAVPVSVTLLGITAR